MGGMTATPAQAAETLTVAVASSVYRPVLQLAQRFEQEQQVNVKLVSGSTGLLYAQIMHGAPYDLFMAADAVTPERLIQQRGLTASALSTYALGHLYLCSRTGAPDIHHLSGRLAMADPRLAPYGRAAEAALRASGAWPAISKSLIYTPNVMLAAAYLQQELVDAALVASSAVGNDLVNSCTPVNPSLYEPIRHQSVLLTYNRNSSAWLSFIRSPAARAIWEQAGFTMGAG